MGRVEPADPNDKEVQKAVKFAVKTYNDMNNDLYISRPIRVMSASQQVGAWPRDSGISLSFRVFADVPVIPVLPYIASTSVSFQRTIIFIAGVTD